VRFGTDTGCRPGQDGLGSASAGRRLSQPVTSAPEGRLVLAQALETTSASLLAVVGGRAGGNRTRWGTSRRLGGLFGVVSRAGSDRDPEVPSDGEGGLLRKATLAAREAREGRAKAQRPVWEASEGRRPGEHRLLLGPNGPERRTDARSEQRSGVGVHAGPSQLREGLDRAESSLRRRCAVRLGGRRDRSSHRIGGLLPTRCG
jgi:hypothetical protein